MRDADTGGGSRCGIRRAGARVHALGGAGRERRRDADRQATTRSSSATRSSTSCSGARRPTPCDCPTARSPSPACASCRRRSRRSTRTRCASPPTPACTRRDVLVVALGADYDMDATPGLAEGANEFYSVAGATALRELLPAFTGGRVVIGVCGAPFKCPPAPSECALMLHDHLVERGLREACDIKIVMPFGRPIPPSPDTSARAARGVRRARHRVRRRPARRLHRSRAQGRSARRRAASCRSTCSSACRSTAPRTWCSPAGWPRTATSPSSRARSRRVTRTCTPWATCATVGVPKAGVFAERAAGVVAAALIAKLRGEPDPEGYDGLGSCYIEFGHGRSPASTSTSSPAPSRRARSSRRPSRWRRRRRTSAPAAGPAGSAASSRSGPARTRHGSAPPRPSSRAAGTPTGWAACRS